MPTAPCSRAISPSNTLSARPPCSLLHPSSPHRRPAASRRLPLWPLLRLAPLPCAQPVSSRSLPARSDSLSPLPDYQADRRILYFRPVDNAPSPLFYRTACPDQC